MSTTIGCRRLQGIWGCLPTSDDGFHTCAHQRAPLHLPASLTILGDQQWRTGGVQWPLVIKRKESNRRNHQTGEGMTSRRFQGSVQQASAIGLSYSACGCTQMLSDFFPTHPTLGLSLFLGYGMSCDCALQFHTRAPGKSAEVLHDTAGREQFVRATGWPAS